MDLLVLIAGILAVILTSFLASVAFARLSGSYRVLRTSLAEIARSEGAEGSLYDLKAEVQIMDFDGLDSPSTLMLVDGDARIQATDPDDLMSGAGITSLVPGDARSLTGTPKALGSYRILGTYESLPWPHLRIRGAKKL